MQAEPDRHGSSGTGSTSTSSAAGIPLTGTGVGISTDDKLENGQHRSTAIYETGQTLPIPVMSTAHPTIRR
jgi:hypothetical protein